MHEVFTRFRTHRREPKGELEHMNAFTLLVAVVLSAQATDAGVNKATRSLFQVADSPEKMAQLGEGGLIEYIRTIGLYQQKAKNVIRLSQILIKEYGGEGSFFTSRAGRAPGCRTKDRECRSEHVVFTPCASG